MKGIMDEYRARATGHIFDDFFQWQDDASGQVVCKTLAVNGRPSVRLLAGISISRVDLGILEPGVMK